MWLLLGVVTLLAGAPGCYAAPKCLNWMTDSATGARWCPTDAISNQVTTDANGGATLTLFAALPDGDSTTREMAWEMSETSTEKARAWKTITLRRRPDTDGAVPLPDAGWIASGDTLEKQLIDPAALTSADLEETVIVVVDVEEHGGYPSRLEGEVWRPPFSVETDRFHPDRFRLTAGETDPLEFGWSPVSAVWARRVGGTMLGLLAFPLAVAVDVVYFPLQTVLGLL